jgi:hypothetical protein
LAYNISPELGTFLLQSEIQGMADGEYFLVEKCENQTNLDLDRDFLGERERDLLLERPRDLERLRLLLPDLKQKFLITFLHK